jgi:hypothetical protein
MGPTPSPESTSIGDRVGRAALGSDELGSPFPLRNHPGLPDPTGRIDAGSKRRPPGVDTRCGEAQAARSSWANCVRLSDA